MDTISIHGASWEIFSGKYRHAHNWAKILNVIVIKIGSEGRTDFIVVWYRGTS
jgi:hypothetical protein